jgi:hypothetical protein
MANALAQVFAVIGLFLWLMFGALLRPILPALDVATVLAVLTGAIALACAVAMACSARPAGEEQASEPAALAFCLHARTYLAWTNENLLHVEALGLIVSIWPTRKTRSSRVKVRIWKPLQLSNVAPLSMRPIASGSSARSDLMHMSPALPRAPPCGALARTLQAFWLCSDTR